MNNFTFPRDGAGFLRTRKGKNPLPAMRSRPGSLPYSPQSSRLAQLSPLMKPFPIGGRQLFEIELTYSQQRRDDFLSGSFLALLASCRVACATLSPRAL